MLRYFDTAPDIHPENEWAEPSFYRTLARGSVDTDPEDMCEPLVVTHVVQITAWGYARALNAILTAPIHDDEPDTERRGVEHYIEDTLANFLAPPTHCYHDWDCCGCRTGSFTAKHIGGAVFLCQASSSRNF